MGRPRKYTGCIVDGCSEPHRAMQYCRRHYHQAHKAGRIVAEECNQTCSACGERGHMRNNINCQKYFKPMWATE